MSYNIIADVAGQYDTLMALIKKMPPGEYISLGDMVDRGPKSKEVVEFFMKNGKAILGNHEHMMIDSYREHGYYAWNTWERNGGRKTVESYAGPFGYTKQHIPEEVIRWMEKLPKYMVIEDILLSHSFLAQGMSLENACKLGTTSDSLTCDASIIWNRGEPVRHPDYKLQICGHNSQFGLERWADEQGEYAICLDDSAEKRLTGLHLPSMVVYQQDYIRK